MTRIFWLNLKKCSQTNVIKLLTDTSEVSALPAGCLCCIHYHDDVSEKMFHLFLIEHLLESLLLANEFVEGNIFTGVCHYVYGGVGISGTRSVLGGGGYVKGSVFGGSVFQSDGYSPPPPIHGTWDTVGYGRQAGGPHPTGMFPFLLCQPQVKKQALYLKWAISLYSLKLRSQRCFGVG